MIDTTAVWLVWAIIALAPFAVIGFVVVVRAIIVALRLGTLVLGDSDR